jgi:hypothetical protein
MVSGDWGRHPDTLIRLEKDGAKPATKWVLQKARPDDPNKLHKPELLEWDTETLGYQRGEITDAKQVGAQNRETIFEAADAGAIERRP